MDAHGWYVAAYLLVGLLVISTVITLVNRNFSGGLAMAIQVGTMVFLLGLFWPIGVIFLIAARMGTFIDDMVTYPDTPDYNGED